MKGKLTMLSLCFMHSKTQKRTYNLRFQILYVFLLNLTSSSQDFTQNLWYISLRQCVSNLLRVQFLGVICSLLIVSVSVSREKYRQQLLLLFDMITVKSASNLAGPRKISILVFT